MLVHEQKERFGYCTDAGFWINAVCLFFVCIIANERRKRFEAFLVSEAYMDWCLVCIVRNSMGIEGSLVLVYIKSKTVKTRKQSVCASGIISLGNLSIHLSRILNFYYSPSSPSPSSSFSCRSVLVGT